MAHTTIEQFATDLKMPAGALLEQLTAAGVAGKKQGDNLSEQDKTRLLDYLRKQHGAAGDGKKRITLTRKQTSEIKAADSSGKARTIQVEVRKKRVLVRREEEAPAPAPVVEEAPVAVAAPPAATAPVAVGVLSPEEIAAREAEARKGQELMARQQEDLQKKQAEVAKRKTKKEREAEEAAARAAAEAKSAEEAKAAAEAAAAAAAAKPAVAKPEGTLHRPAAKPGEKREKPAKKAPGQVFQEEAARRRALRLRGDTTGGAATGWRGPKGGRHGRPDEETGDASGAQSAQAGPMIREISVPETITVADLAHRMSVKAAEVIKALMKLGSMVTINQVIDQETAMILVEEMGHKAKAAKLDDPDSMLVDTEQTHAADALPRPPMVT